MPNLQPHSDEHYLQAIHSDEDRIIQVFYNHAYPISRLVLSRECQLNDDEQFKDIYQDSFCLFLSKVKEGNFRLTSELTTFLIGICKKKAKRHVLKRNRETQIGEEEYLADETTPFDKYVDRYENGDEHKGLLIEAELERMQVKSADCYTLLDLSLRREVSNQEIARQMNKGIDVIKTQKSRCLGYLRKAVFNRLNFE